MNFEHIKQDYNLQPKVSIIVPVYNKVDYIDMMLQSVYNQLWDNIELIFINDGATDGTRERLSVWESMFYERGYRVIIIDQENQGIPGAVKKGLLNITGDYVCVVDCDDLLDSEYVSSMAEWLSEHIDDMWVACTYDKIKVYDNKYEIFDSVDISHTPSPPNIADKYLSYDYTTAIWIYMVRTDYLKECNVIENYITDIRATQEPGYFFPLAIGDGKIKIIDKTLYHHNYYPAKTSACNTVSETLSFLNNYTEMTLKTISNLSADNTQKEKWRIMTKIKHICLLSHCLQNDKNYDNQLYESVSELVLIINKYFIPAPYLSVEYILNNDIRWLFKALSDCILSNKLHIDTTGYMRIIGCGVLGNNGIKRIPQLIGTVLEPTDLWDNQAIPGNSICDIPVTKPDYSSLNENDIVIIFPHNSAVKSTLLNEVKNREIKLLFDDNTIYELMPYLKYPHLYGDCCFSVTL